MPKRKPVKSLQDQCLYNIIANLDHHCRIYREMCKAGDRKNTSYKPFQKLYSEKIMDMLSDAATIPDTLCPLARDCLSFECEDKTKPEEKDYLEFFLNPYTRNLNLSKEDHFSYWRRGTFRREDLPRPIVYIPTERRQFSLTGVALNTIVNIAENLSIVEMQMSGICLEDLNLLLKSIPKVLTLNVSRTCFSDDQIAVVKTHCHLLKQLDMSFTSITDEGVKYLCSDNSEDKIGLCKLSSLNIRSTFITCRGTRMILESLPHLEDLQYFGFCVSSCTKKYEQKYERFLQNGDFDPSIPISLIFGGVVRILFDINKHNLSKKNFINVRKCNLKELYFGAFETEEEVLQSAPVCFPEVTSVHIHPKMPPQYLKLCTAFSRLSNITLYLKAPIPTSELREMFTIQGIKIKTLRLVFNFAFFEDYFELLFWLTLCPNLKKFSFSSAALLKTELKSENAVKLLNERRSIKELPTALSNIILRVLSGSGLAEFLTVLLSSATHLTELSIGCFGNVTSEAIREAHRIHGFQYLEYLNLSSDEFSMDMFYWLLRFHNLKTLGHPFSLYRRTEAYEEIREMVKRENLDIDVLDIHWTPR